MIDVPEFAFVAIVLVAPETWLLGGYIASLLFIKTQRLVGKSTNATRLVAFSQQPNMSLLNSSPPYTPDPIRSFTTTPTSSQGSETSSESDQTAHAPPSSPPDNDSDAKSNTDAESSTQSSGIPSDLFDDSTEGRTDNLYTRHVVISLWSSSSRPSDSPSKSS